MKYLFFATIAFTLALVSGNAQAPPPPPHSPPDRGVTPKNGFVPDAETAIRIGQAVLTPVYGEKMILAERPFTATLQGPVWIVEGTVHCNSLPNICPGGAAVVKISKTSARIVYMTHYQ